MHRAKCSPRSKDGSNQSRIITVCNRGRNLIGNQLARRSNPGKSNINWEFRRAKWPDIIPKLKNCFVNGVNNGYPLIKNKFSICSNSLLNLVIRTNLECET